MRNIVLRQDMSKLLVALGFDKWVSSGKAKGGRGGYIGADEVAMEKHIAHLEDDLYHAQQTALVEKAKVQRELEELRRQLEVALSEQEAHSDAKVWALEQDNDDLRYENRQLRVELWTMRHIRWGMLQWRARVRAWKIKRARCVDPPSTPHPRRSTDSAMLNKRSLVTGDLGISTGSGTAA